MTEKLPRRIKWIYGSGDLGFSLTNTILSVYFALFLTDVVGVKPSVAALAIFIGSTWDYLNDPFIGYLSDRTKSRWGRRRPFLLFGALPFAMAFMLLWWKPPFDGTVALAIYYSVAFALYDTAATFVYMPYFALTPELTDDYDERTGLTSTRMFFSILGSLIAFTLPIWVVDGFQPEHANRVLWMGAMFGLISALPLFLVFFNTREHPEYMHKEQTLGIKESIKATWQNKPFFFGLGMFLFNGVTMSIIQVILLYYVKYVVEREAQSDMIMAHFCRGDARPTVLGMGLKESEQTLGIYQRRFIPGGDPVDPFCAYAGDKSHVHHGVMCIGGYRRLRHACDAVGDPAGCHRIWRMENRRTTGRYVL